MPSFRTCRGTGQVPVLDPQHPFGHGLSYRKFAYSNLELSPGKLNAGDSLTVDVDVRNTSPQDGDEVAQLDLTYAAILECRFAPSTGSTGCTCPQARRTIYISRWVPRDLGMVDEGENRVIAPGTYEIDAGSEQPGTAASTVKARFSLADEAKLPE